MKVLFQGYLFLVQKLYDSRILGWFGVGFQRIEAFRNPGWKNLVRLEHDTVWFHAASVGELEILIPVIEAFAKERLAWGVSVFSESALPFLNRLPTGAVYAGLSPGELDWPGLLEKFRVKKFIVSKYEAWPAMWAACSAAQVPLLVLNAQKRRSLSFARRILKICGIPLPRLFFYTLDKVETQSLSLEFPEVRVMTSMDPRILRIQDRALNASNHPRVQFWKDKFGNLPRPFLLVGSAWLEDLKVVMPEFKKNKGTLWVVPHSLETANLDRIEHELKSQLPGRFVLVDEMGFLLELYSLADQIFVGGGFGKGIHSTSEAAIYGVPVGCGPKRVKEFFETRKLIETGQLSVLENSKQVGTWLQNLSQRADAEYGAQKIQGAVFLDWMSEWKNIQ